MVGWLFFCIKGYNEGAHMAPGICPDWAILILTGQTELASEAYVGILPQFYQALVEEP